MSIFLDFLNKQVENKNISIEEWLLNVAENASKCTLGTNVGKFTHPSIATVILQPTVSAPAADGYLHTANTNCQFDIATSASYAGTAKFLLLTIEDGRCVFMHLKENSEIIQREFLNVAVNYEEIRKNFLQIKTQLPSDTDERLRQVYFPTKDGGYHVLSVLPPSSLLMEMKTRIKAMEQQALAARNTKSEQYGETYAQIYDLTQAKFGGTQPQNISILNSSQAGWAYLLSALPPMLEQREVVRPHNDFFTESLRPWHFKKSFQMLHHQIFLAKQNNKKIRQQRDRIICDEIIDRVLLIVYKLRELEAGWSDKQGYQLPIAQKIWLDNQYKDIRANDDEWLPELADKFSYWLIFAYEKVMKDKNIALGQAERLKFRQAIEDVLNAER